MKKLFLFILFFNASVIFSSASEKPEMTNNSIPKEKIDAVNNSLNTKKNYSHGENEVKYEPDQQNKKIIHQQTLVQQNISKVLNKTITEDVGKIPPSYNGPKIIDPESTFVTNGSMILISVSLLFMIFVAFKTYRRKSRDARIKKYGIRLARGNIEMTPLPLDNDDDDETIFDLKNVPT